jgi:hypothetical protein
VDDSSKKNGGTAFGGEATAAWRSRRASRWTPRQVFDKDENNDEFDHGEDVAAWRRRKGQGEGRVGGGEGALPADEGGVLLDGRLAPPPLAIMTINKGGAQNQSYQKMGWGVWGDNDTTTNSTTADVVEWDGWCRWDFPLFTLVRALALNSPYFVVGIVAYDSHERRNFCSPVNQIFHEVPMAASTIQSSVSNDFLCVRFDHRLSHLYAFIAKLSILASFFQIILTLAAIFLGWQHVDSLCGKVLGVREIKIIK